MAAALLHARKGERAAPPGAGSPRRRVSYRAAAALLPAATAAEAERAQVLAGQSAALLHALDFAGARTVAVQALALRPRRRGCARSRRGSSPCSGSASPTWRTRRTAPPPSTRRSRSPRAPVSRRPSARPTCAAPSCWPGRSTSSTRASPTRARAWSGCGARPGPHGRAWRC